MRRLLKPARADTAREWPTPVWMVPVLLLAGVAGSALAYNMFPGMH